MDTEEFRKLVDKALEELPDEFKEKLDNVTVFVEDLPTREQLIRTGTRGTLLGLYEGVPQTRRGRYGVGPTVPDRILLFRIPILSMSRSLEEVERQVKDTVLHEIAHHFGMDEERIRRAQHPVLPR